MFFEITNELIQTVCLVIIAGYIVAVAGHTLFAKLLRRAAAKKNRIVFLLRTARNKIRLRFGRG